MLMGNVKLFACWSWGLREISAFKCSLEERHQHLLEKQMEGNGGEMAMGQLSVKEEEK